MAKNIYVGNLPWKISNNELQALFQAHGTVKRAEVIMDRETGRSRGFAFVTMANRTEGQAAIEGLQGRELDGRALSVNEARPREERSGGSGRPGWPSRPSGGKQRC